MRGARQMKHGIELIQEVNRRKVGHGHLCFWWLGQLGFILKTSRKIFYLDPYLNPSLERLCPPLLEPGEVVNADIITGSHDHSDHLDHWALPGIMKASPSAILVAPDAHLPALLKTGLDESRLRLLDDGIVFSDDGVKITAIKAAHEFFDDEKFGGRFPHLSFMIETDGVVVFHSGDTCIYEGLTTRLKEWKIDLAFLPINGRDARRLRSNCIGNMTYQEAVDLAGAVKPRWTVPGHFGMFAKNTEDPSHFTEYMDVKYPDVKYLVPKIGYGMDLSCC